MKRILIYLFVLGCLPVVAVAQQQSLDKMIAQLESSKGLQITFEISDPEAPEPIKGEYKGLGKAFHYTTPQMKAWYDGKNLWVYLQQSEEVNLSVPMKEDLAMINPLLALDNVKQNDFKLTEQKAKDGAITLTAVPKKKSVQGLQKLIVSADKQYKPLKLDVYEAGLGKPIIVKVLRMERGAFPEMKEVDYFKFTENKLPGKLVIDLR